MCLYRFQALPFLGRHILWTVNPNPFSRSKTFHGPWSFRPYGRYKAFAWRNWSQEPWPPQPPQCLSNEYTNTKKYHEQSTKCALNLWIAFAIQFDGFRDHFKAFLVKNWWYGRWIQIVWFTCMLRKEIYFLLHLPTYFFFDWPGKVRSGFIILWWETPAKASNLQFSPTYW